VLSKSWLKTITLSSLPPSTPPSPSSLSPASLPELMYHNLLLTFIEMRFHPVKVSGVFKFTNDFSGLGKNCRLLERCNSIYMKLHPFLVGPTISGSGTN
jgi:hypothetical protein